MKWLASLALAAMGCGGVSADNRSPEQAVWADIFERGDVAPYVDWREGDCNGPKFGLSVYVQEARTTYCLGGQAMSEDYVWVARWPGASLSDKELARRVAHEFAHSYIMRLGVYDGDYNHDGPEWLPGGLVERAALYLTTR